MSRTTITMEASLQEKAKDFGINVSEICREAVRHVVASAEEARKHGDDFETVSAQLGSYDQLELVEFHGRSVFTDETHGFEVYITTGGQVALVDPDGFLEYGSLEDMRLPGVVRQAVEEALSRAVTPTFLDI